MENKIKPELKEAFINEIKAYEKKSCCILIGSSLDKHSISLLNAFTDLMQAAYILGSDLWISIAIKQPEKGRDIWVWHLVMNCETIITYEDESDLQWFKYWRPVVLLGNPERSHANGR